MLMNFIKKHLFTMLIALLVTGVIGYKFIMPKIMGHFAPPMPSTHVETLVLKLQPGSEHFQAMGTVKAAQDIIVSSEVSGTIEKLNVANGSQVNQNDVIITIRHQDVAANLQRDEAAYQQKELFYHRLQKLIPKHAISDEAVSEAKSAYQQAKAAVDADRALLDKYVIRAPFKGQIGLWQADIGQLVQPGAALVTLTAMTPTYVDFMLPAKGLGSVKVGDSIQFTTPSYPNHTWPGKVIALDPQLDAATRSVKFRALVDNSDNKLVPRLYGDVTVIKPQTPRLIIPQEAITYNPQGAAVYVLEKKSPVIRQITLGEHIDNDVVIVSGLKENEEIITAGMLKIFPGMPVAVNKQIVQKPFQPTKSAS